MAIPIQIVVGKDIPNLLIAEDLIKILRDLIPPFPPKSLSNSRSWNDKTTEAVIIFLAK